MEEQKDNEEINEEAVEAEVEEISPKKQKEEEYVPWYIIQCYSGQEHKVRDRIERVMSDNKSLKKAIVKILLPEEETIEIKNNKRIEKVVKLYPGYLFLR